jgi:hypothetical protein
MQHTPTRRPHDQRPTVIEVDGEPLGVVVPAAEGFRFLAVKLPVFDIDGQTFATIEDATRAATTAMADAA